MASHCLTSYQHYVESAEQKIKRARSYYITENRAKPLVLMHHSVHQNVFNVRSIILILYHLVVQEIKRRRERCEKSVCTLL
jgi:hypothetical protein